MNIRSLCIVLACSLVAFPRNSVAQVVKLLATDPSAPGTTTGHAFIIIAYPTGTGIKEEAYGFYPVPNAPRGGLFNKLFNHQRAGELRNEMKSADAGDLLAHAHQYIEANVSDDQLRKIHALIAAYEKRGFRSYTSNCVSFVHDVSGVMQLQTPKSSSFKFPFEYLSKVMTMNPETVRTVPPPEQQQQQQQQQQSQKHGSGESREGPHAKDGGGGGGGSQGGDKGRDSGGEKGGGGDGGEFKGDNHPR